MMVRSTTTSVQQSATKSKCERNVDTDDDSSQSLSDDENHLYKILTNLKNSNGITLINVGSANFFY